MLCYAMLCYVMFCYVMICSVLLCYVMYVMYVCMYVCMFIYIYLSIIFRQSHISTAPVPFLFASARHGKPLPTALQPLP